jgi:hypothetical protein
MAGKRRRGVKPSSSKAIDPEQSSTSVGDNGEVANPRQSVSPPTPTGKTASPPGDAIEQPETFNLDTALNELFEDYEPSTIADDPQQQLRQPSTVADGPQPQHSEASTMVDGSEPQTTEAATVVESGQPQTSEASTVVDSGQPQTPERATVVEGGQPQTTEASTVVDSGPPQTPQRPGTPKRAPSAGSLKLVDGQPKPIQTPPKKVKTPTSIRDVQRSKVVDKHRMGTAVLCVAALDPIWPVSQGKR